MTLTPTMKLLNNDCSKAFESIPDRSVDLMVLDPPYYRAVKEDWDNEWFVIEDWINWCDSWLKELGRVSKWSGSLWLFGYPYQLSKLLPLVESHGFTFRQQIVLDKGLKSVAGRTSSKLKQYPTASESIYFFHYDARDHIRGLLQDLRSKLGLNGNEMNKLIGKATTGGGTFACIASEKKPLEHRTYPTKKDWELFSKHGDLPPYEDVVYPFNLETRLTDVWSDIDWYDRSVKKIHPTQKPVKLIERIINSSSLPNQVVLDPFMGSGTTGVACKNTGRQFIGIEKDPEYFTLAQTRIN